VPVRVVAAALCVICCACGGTSREREARVRVPSLVGASWGEAVDRIARVGLCIGGIEVQPATSISGPDEVLRQKPRAGAKVAPRARVSITVSPSGPSGSIVGYSFRGCRGATQYYIAPGG
jgi:hypothetical protein